MNLDRSSRRFYYRVKAGDLNIQPIDPQTDEYIQQRDLYVKPTQIQELQPSQDEELTQKLAKEQEAYSKKARKNLYGIYPTIPDELFNKMMSAGVPWWLAQHPNEYSANPNEVLKYRNQEDFIQSPFYEKYKKGIIKVSERKGYGKTQREIIKGKPLRIVFASRSDYDNTQYYYDPKDDDEYIEMLNDAKDSNILVPIELLSKEFIDKNIQKSAIRVMEDKRVWSAGYDYADRKWREQEQENSEDNSAWGGLKKGFEIGTELASFF